MELRMPDRRLLSVGQRFYADDGALHAFVEFRRSSGQLWEFALILSDGRAFFREMDVSDDEAARALASSLEGLLAAVEEDRVEADATQEEIPDVAKPQPTPLEVDTESRIEVPVEVEPEPEAVVSAPSFVEGGATSICLGGGATLGLTGAGGLRAGGFSLSADHRFERGGAVVMQLAQGFSGERDELLSRTRVAIGGGYTWRGSSIELPLWVLAAVEPWQVTREGSRAETHEQEAEEGEDFSTPLLGLGFRTGLRGRLDLPRREALKILVGFTVEAWMSGASPGFEALRIQGEDELWLGGGELRVGLELGLRFGHASRR
jgi:hypothetical protein